MLNSIFANGFSIVNLFVSLITALAMGVLITFIFTYKDRMSKTLSYALTFLPVAMAMIVMMINGNLGVAISVAGSFTLVRFRSIAGTGKEIVAVFIDMVLGTIIGMGYLGISIVFFGIVAIAMIVLNNLNYGENPKRKILKVTIPEDYDYENLLDDVFNKYNAKGKIDKIKTLNMGSLVEVTYQIELAKDILPKAMLDDIRARNGNLSVILTSESLEYNSL